MTGKFEQRTRKYAEIIVRVGLNLQPGQKLVINAPIAAASLVRQVTAVAYQSGCRFVEVNWGDELITLTRFQYAPRDSFEEVSAWRFKAMEAYIREGAAFLSFAAEDPDLLKDQDPQLIQTAMLASMKLAKPVRELMMNNAANWCVVSMPVPSWANKVFPDLSPDQQEERLWQAIFDTVRINEPDPVAAWKSHIAHLEKRSRYLNEKRYAALKYTAPGTDFTVGLADDHVWVGGSSRTQGGQEFVPNLPTEEVFTMPHKDRAEGTVTSTMPLSYAGKLIKNFSLTFKDGRVVDYQAEEGLESLKNLLDTDEGARRLGEVALVPVGSPVARSGLLFYNTLFDENAASHLALGKAYPFNMAGSDQKSPEEFAAAGGNTSMTHDDFMIGSDKMDVDGICADGTSEPLMRQGEWVFSV